MEAVTTPIAPSGTRTVFTPEGALTAVVRDRKQPQFILAMHDAYFHGLNEDNFPVNGLNVYPTIRFLMEAQSHLVIAERQALEANDTYRQLLPYVVVKYAGDDGVARYATYKRSNATGETKLHNKFSCGYGGHIDLADISFAREGKHASVVDLDHTIRMSAAREVFKEELKAKDPSQQIELMSAIPNYCNKFIVSDRGVDQVHLAIIMEVHLPMSLPVVPAEVQLEDAGILTAEEILALEGVDGGEVESWTKLYLQHELAG